MRKYIMVIWTIVGLLIVLVPVKLMSITHPIMSSMIPTMPTQVRTLVQLKLS